MSFVKTTTVQDWWGLPKWKQDYWTGYLDSVGWKHDRCFAFNHIGPIPVGAGLYKEDDHGNFYAEGDDIAFELVGLRTERL